MLRNVCITCGKDFLCDDCELTEDLKSKCACIECCTEVWVRPLRLYGMMVEIERVFERCFDNSIYDDYKLLALMLI